MTKDIKTKHATYEAGVAQARLDVAAGIERPHYELPPHREAYPEFARGYEDAMREAREVAE